VKNGKPYAIMEESPAQTCNPDSGKRKPGAQPGHRGHFRKVPVIREQIAVRASEQTCPECSSTLVRRGFRKRIVEDIPPVNPRVIQYHIDRMYCNRCRKMFEPEIPDVLPNARLSLRTMLIIVFMKIGMKMSLENVSITMREIFGIHVSEGEVQNILYQISDALGPEYNRLIQEIRNAPARNMDTTSWRISGENNALWVSVTEGEALFHIARSNNHEVALGFLGDHSGTDVHDRHSAFETLAKKTHNDQQYCRSHILCDAKELEQFYGGEGRTIKEALQKMHNDAKSFHGHGSMDDVKGLHHRLVFLPDKDYDHSGSGKFVDNLLKRKKEWLFRFVVDKEVESTNNRAERSLKLSVIARKTLGGS
jgi:hypothetical protein